MLKKKKKRKNSISILLGFLIALFFAVVFVTPIVLTITNSFMGASEIYSNYGVIFETTESGGKVYVSETVNLKFIPEVVSFSQYVTVLLKSPDYLLKFWNSVMYVVPIVVFQLFVALLASFGFTRYSGRIKQIIFFGIRNFPKKKSYLQPVFLTIWKKKDFVSQKESQGFRPHLLQSGEQENRYLDFWQSMTLFRVLARSRSARISR